jgi:1-acyl-sn-glycerol-3-phosphate acyltransferase
MLLAPFYLALLTVLYPLRRRIGPPLVKFWSRICLRIFRVEVKTEGDLSEEDRRGTLIVSNHTSFLDIFILSAFFGAVFVSKAEVRHYPVIGQIAWLMGVIFLERTSSGERLKVLSSVARNCSDRVVAVFPQGTTGRARERLPFQRGIFKIVELNPSVVLQPLTLHYKEDDEVSWYKPLTMREHAIRVFSKEKISVSMVIHQTITIADYQNRASSEICRLVEERVTAPLLRGMTRQE